MAFPDLEFEAAITRIEQDLDALKQRYQDILTASAKLAELTEQKQQISHQAEAVQKQQSLKTELHLIESEIEKLEVQLESHLLDWREPFWQIVRFTGLGILIGWFLKTVA